MDNNISGFLNKDLEIIQMKDVFQKYIKYYRLLQGQIKEELKKLPRGVVKKRIKNGGKYCYYCLEYREDGKVVNKHIGKNEPKELIEQTRRGNILRKRLREIDDNLFALGWTRRRNGTALAKRFAILNRDNFTCQYCGRNVKTHKIVLHVDHIIPKKRGGGDELSNLITSCEDCNLSKMTSLVIAQNENKD